MIYVGIDAGKRHWVCVLDENRREVVPTFCVKNDRKSYEELAQTIGQDAKVCIEDTGSYSLPLYQFLKSKGIDIKMIKGSRSKHLRKFIHENIKTDPVDCEVLALVRLVEKTLPSTKGAVIPRDNPLGNIARLYWAPRRCEWIWVSDGNLRSL